MIPVPTVDEIDMMFGGGAMKILPSYDKIPDEFKACSRCTFGGKTQYLGKEGIVIAAKWLSLFADWFFYGIKNTKWSPKEGIDQKAALRAIKCCMNSWDPSQEHKEAGVAYLLSQWFDDVTYERAK